MVSIELLVPVAFVALGLAALLVHRVREYLAPDELPDGPVERVHRLGPETSLAVAQHFDSYDTFLHADREEYQAVPGIGPNLANG